MQDLPKNMLSPESLRDKLGISEATYFRWLREGKLKGQRAGRNWRFSEATVEHLLSEGSSVSNIRRDVLAAIKTYRTLLLQAGVPKREVQAIADENKSSKSGRSTLAKMMLEHAAANNAAAIHIDQESDGVHVRERIDGALALVADPFPRGSARELLQVFKDMAGLTEESAPVAEGRFVTIIGGRKFYVSASTYPSASGESLTLKLLAANSAISALDQFDLSADQLKMLQGVLGAPNGAIIVTGPHGCGKTSTAYALLQELRKDPHIKIMTAEDPVEFHIEGVQQADVGGPSSIGHYKALQGMLHADLDVGMVSELGDTATIDLFFRAAHKGHLMVGIMNSPDPIHSVKTIMDIGKVSPLMLATNLLAVINQRLFRRSCPHCRNAMVISAEDASNLGLSGSDQEMTVSYNNGCERCRHTGFKGKILVVDIFTPSDDFKAALESNIDIASDSGDRNGTKGPLWDLLLEKVRQGHISPKEVAAFYKT